METARYTGVMGSKHRNRLAKTSIPEGWRDVRLGDVADVNPRRPRLNVDDDEPTTFIPMASVAEDCAGIVAREARPYGDVSHGYTYFEENDVLFAKITPCLQNGKHTLATGLEGGFGFGTTEFHVIRAGLRIDPRHLFRALTSPVNIERCEKGFNGTAGQQRVHPDTIRGLPLLLPPFSEQQAIAAVLDSIDTAIERTEAAIAALEQLRRSLFHELLTRGIPGWHTEWKDVPGLGIIPAKWDVVRLGEVAQVRNGTTPSRRSLEYWQDGEIPFVKTGRVNDVFIDVPDEFITHEAISAGAVSVPSGSVLIAMIGQGKTRGMTARLGFDAAINQNFAAVFEPVGDFSLDFFFAWARQNYSVIRGLGQGSNQDALNCALIEGMRVPKPSVLEQRQITAALKALDLSTYWANQERASLQALKAATSDALLTGRVRLDGDAG